MNDDFSTFWFALVLSLLGLSLANRDLPADSCLIKKLSNMWIHLGMCLVSNNVGFVPKCSKPKRKLKKSYWQVC